MTRHWQAYPAGLVASSRETPFSTILVYYCIRRLAESLCLHGLHPCTLFEEKRARSWRGLKGDCNSHLQADLNSPDIAFSTRLLQQQECPVRPRRAQTSMVTAGSDLIPTIPHATLRFQKRLGKPAWLRLVEGVVGKTQTFVVVCSHGIGTLHLFGRDVGRCYLTLGCQRPSQGEMGQ